MKKNVAIIDLGSNSVRALVMKIYLNGAYTMADEAKFMIRLSEGMEKEKILRLKSLQKAICAIRAFRLMIDRFHVSPMDIHCVATAAVRRARNGEHFLNMLKQKTGLQFEAISSQQETYYSYLGAVNTMNIQNFLMIDVGGASTEVALVKDRKLKEFTGLDFGAVTLSEMFLGYDRIDLDGLKTADSLIMDHFKKESWFEESRGLPIVGIGGSIRTIAKINKKQTHFPFERIHNYQLSKTELLKIFKEIFYSNLKERKNIKGLGKTRADIIAGGLLPLQCLMNHTHANQLIISGNGLREGLFYYHYAKEFETMDSQVEDVLWHSISNLLKLYDMNIAHCHHVKDLALKIFDQTTDLHHWGLWERKMISIAALLHDIGTYVDYYNHQQHGFYLVLNSQINGLTNRELVYCAFLVGMHRFYSLKESWSKYKTLISKEDYKKITKMSLFVKIAEHLDRREYGKIQKVECSMDQENVYIDLISDSNLELEINSTIVFEKDFKKLMNRNLVISQKYYIPV